MKRQASRQMASLKWSRRVLPDVLRPEGGALWGFSTDWLNVDGWD